VPYVDSLQPAVDRPKWLNDIAAAVGDDVAGEAGAAGAGAGVGVGGAEPEVVVEPVQKKRPCFKRPSVAVEELKAELLSGHNLCHFPSNPLCPTCKVTGVSAAHHTGGFEKYERRADGFGKVVILDHKIVADTFSGIGGEKACLIVTDVFSRFTCAFPSPTKDADQVQECLLAMFGRKDGVRLLCDGAREYKSACHRLGWALHPATPHDPTNHAAQERRVGLVSAGIRRLLHRSGMPLALWPMAAVTWSVHHNAVARNDDGITPWHLRFNEDFSGPLHAFGSACQVVFPLEVRRGMHPFASSATPCVYLGPSLADGCEDTSRVVVASEEVVSEHLVSGKPLTTVIVKLADVKFDAVERFPFFKVPTVMASWLQCLVLPPSPIGSKSMCLLANLVLLATLFGQSTGKVPPETKKLTQTCGLIFPQLRASKLAMTSSLPGKSSRKR